MAALAGCGLPRSGPTKSEIYRGSVQRNGNAFIIEVDDVITHKTRTNAALGFSPAFSNAGTIGADTIRAGDTLGLTIWENVDDGLLASQSQKQTVLEAIQVDGDGYIFVPFAGRVRAAGNSPDELRRAITQRLEQQTPDPQVEVRRLSGDGATVSVVGAVAAQGVYPIERSTRTLSAMIARAGGVVIEPEAAQIVISRGNREERVWFQDIYRNTSNDIALRAGDRIFIEQDARSFTAIGATGSQTQVVFGTHTLSAMEALARVGGLSGAAADPTGIFIIRNEQPQIANSVLGRGDLNTPQRFAYVINMTQPTGLFYARDFDIRDGDTIYVTEAPFAQWSKVIAAISGSLGGISGIVQGGNIVANAAPL